MKTEAQLKSFTESKTLIINTFQEKYDAARIVADERLKSIQIQCIGFIARNAPSHLSDTLINGLTVDISNHYINFNMRLTDDTSDWFKLATLSKQSKYTSPGWVDYYQLEGNISNRFSELEPNLLKFKLFNVLVDIFTDDKKLEELKNFAIQPELIYKECGELSSIINSTRGEINSAQEEFNKSVANILVSKLITKGSLIRMSSMEKPMFYRTSKRRGGFSYTHIEIIKITPTKLHFAYQREYKVDGNTTLTTRYNVKERKVTKEEFRQILLNNSEIIKQFNTNLITA